MNKEKANENKNKQAPKCDSIIYCQGTRTSLRGLPLLPWRRWAHVALQTANVTNSDQKERRDKEIEIEIESVNEIRIDNEQLIAPA